jgi:hypothetical protein
VYLKLTPVNGPIDEHVMMVRERIAPFPWMCPEIVRVLDVMLNDSLNPQRGGNPIRLPQVQRPVATNVPGYGPLAVPCARKMASARANTPPLQVRCLMVTSRAVKVSPLSPASGAMDNTTPEARPALFAPPPVGVGAKGAPLEQATNASAPQVGSAAIETTRSKAFDDSMRTSDGAVARNPISVRIRRTR